MTMNPSLRNGAMLITDEEKEKYDSDVTRRENSALVVI